MILDYKGARPKIGKNVFIAPTAVVIGNVEIMDNATIKCVEGYAKIGLPLEMAALLLIEVDGHSAVVAEEADGVKAVLQKVGAAEIQEAKDAEHAGQLAAARRTALSALALDEAAIDRALVTGFDETSTAGSCFVTNETVTRWRVPMPSTMNFTKRFLPGVGLSPANTA